jgi:hypothetical protein
MILEHHVQVVLLLLEDLLQNFCCALGFEAKALQYFQRYI